MATEMKKHPLATAWDSWLASSEGVSCRNYGSLLGSGDGTYLENRLYRAFQAGIKAAESTAPNTRQRAERAAAELDRNALLYTSRGDRSLTQAELKQIIAIIAAEFDK